MRVFPCNFQINHCKFLLFIPFMLRQMSSVNLKPPEHVRGMKVLDRKLFQKTVKIPFTRIKSKETAAALLDLKKLLLKIENFKPIQAADDGYSKMYLRETPSDYEVFEDEVTLNYENYTLEAIFKAILPEETDGFSSFTQMGHLVHVNLRENLWPFKAVIGEILYSKVAHCKTVVNKSSNIDNTYRNFELEVLKGEPDFLVKIKENRCVFELDFSKVYWNSRLSTEHERIVKLIPDRSTVFDIFAGIGPFSIPLAKKNCTVFANDLNPEAYKYLVQNAKINKIKADNLRVFNRDGKDFILEDLPGLLSQCSAAKNVYILMNLPAIAVEFLTHFVGLLDEVPVEPILIVYCFAKGENPVEITRNLFNPLFQSKILDIVRVRTVSNFKEMMRVSLRLDDEVLKKTLKRQGEDLETASKKCN